MANAKPKFREPPVLKLVEKVEPVPEPETIPEPVQSAEENFAAGLLIGMFLEQQRRKIVVPGESTRALIGQVAARHGFTVSDVLSARRDHKLVEARFDAIAAVYRAKPELTLPRLGAIFNRDHTSILHALRKRGIEYQAKHPAPGRP